MRLALSTEPAFTDDGGATPLSAPSDARATYFAQKRRFLRRRGGARVGHVAIPKTTTADVLALIDWWTHEADKLKTSEQLDNDERATLRRWHGCAELVRRRAKSLAPTATYPDNAHVWHCIERLALRLTRRSLAPSWWDGARALSAQLPTIADGVVDAIEERIDRLGDRVTANVGKVSTEAGASIGSAAVNAAVSSALVPAALAGGGIVAAALLLRFTAGESRGSKRTAKAATSPARTKRAKPTKAANKTKKTSRGERRGNKGGRS